MIRNRKPAFIMMTPSSLLIIATSVFLLLTRPPSVNAWPDLMNLNFGDLKNSLPNLGDLKNSLPNLNTLKSSFNSVKTLIGYETCSTRHVRPSSAAIKYIQSNLQDNLFGQHLAQALIIPAIKGHLDEGSPKKALVLSLHGWSGSGKTFTTQLISKSLYELGDNSKFIKFYSPTYHFPDPGKVPEYKEILKQDIIDTVKLCERSVFVFDEVDKYPVGLLDILKPIIKAVGQWEKGVDFNNAGAAKINEIAMQAKVEGRLREDLKISEFQEVLSNEAFNGGDKGLYRSELIDKILVDWFVPFLPLERKHVMQCIQRDLKYFGETMEVWKFKSGKSWNKVAEEIADELVYWPGDEEEKGGWGGSGGGDGRRWFSQTGCKRVESLVRFHVTEATLTAEGGGGKISKRSDL